MEAAVVDVLVQQPPGLGTPNPTIEQVFTKVSGSTIVMKANMKFIPEEWQKLTPAQKTQLHAVKGIPSTP